MRFKADTQTKDIEFYRAVCNREGPLGLVTIPYLDVKASGRLNSLPVFIPLRSRKI